MKTTATKKGQIVIPVKLRKKYGIEAGTTIHVEDKDGEIVLKPITAEYIRSLRGIVKPKKGQRSALDILKEERKADRIKEDQKYGF